MPKLTGNNRISALKRLGNPYSLNNNINRKGSSGNDARQLLVSRNSTSFDARQLLNRQGSKTKVDEGNTIVVTGLRDMKMQDGRLISKSTDIDSQTNKKKAIYNVGPSTFVTIRNNNNANAIVNQSTDKFSLTKTIANPSVQQVHDHRSPTTNTFSSLSDQKVVISFVNDKYQKTPTPPPPPPPPTQITKSSASTTVIKRVHDASIQTVSSTRSPIRINTHRSQTTATTDDDNDDDDEDYSTERTIADEMDEPPLKRTTTSIVRKATTNRESQSASTPTTAAAAGSSVKRTSTGAPVSSRISSSVIAVNKKPTTTQVVSTPGTILVTNLQPSVTEDDVTELFGEIGRITEIKTLSQGCIRITYAKREHCEQAVAKYHNRLLDGQFMYVSFQQPQSTSTTEKSKSTMNNSQQSTDVSNKPSSSSSSSSSSTATANQPLKFNTNTSTKSSLDPAFIRQALFHPSNNSTNPVQFQVKL